MERKVIVEEYFQLRDFMNRANRLANQVMEIKFEIEIFDISKYTFYVISRGKNETHRLAIAYRGPGRTWERAGATRFSRFEEFCARCLNEFEDNLDDEQAPSKRPRILLDHFKKRLADQMSSRLNMLLLKHGYEP
jgi:hypothetical protein